MRSRLGVSSSIASGHRYRKPFARALLWAPEPDAPMGPAAASAAGEQPGGKLPRVRSSNTGASGQRSRACDIAAAGVGRSSRQKAIARRVLSQTVSDSCARSRNIVDGSIAEAVCVH